MKQTLPSIEDCQKFLRGDGPSNSLDRALFAKMNASELRQKLKEEQASMRAYQASKNADLDRIQRESLAAKEKRKAAFRATKEAFEKQRRERVAIEQRIASKPATKGPAPAARPLKAEATATLARALKLKNTTENERKAIHAELEARGVTLLKTGFSQPVR